MLGFNGGLIGKLNTYKSSGDSSGMWTLQEQSVIRSLVIASGGDTTDTFIDGITYRIHSFTTVGVSTFTVTSGGTIEYLIIGGGGGGGGGWQGGGGGAGGYLTGTAVVSAQEYTITVGAGGTGCRQGGAGVVPTNGGDSSISNINTSIGGGRGSSENPDAVANTGGSGGGGMNFFPAGAAGTPGQGFAGGDGLGPIPPSGGGGGGSSGVGTTATSGVNQPAGGAGTESSITGEPVTYAAGGSGALRSANITPAASASNRGNGGGAGSNSSNGSRAGANGGSGIVIIRYQIIT